MSEPEGSMRVALERRPAALLLDLDQTLVDNSAMPELVRRTCRSVAADVEGLDADDLLQANLTARAEYWPEVERRTWVGEMELLDVSREIWRRALKACGCEDETVAQLAFETLQQLGRKECRPFDDVPDFIAEVRRLGVGVAVVTNGSSLAQREKLRSCGLENMLDAVVISGEIGVAKPDPAPFLAALDQLGVAPSWAWHIGDSLACDVVGAASAGVTAVWLNRTGTVIPDGASPPDLEASSLTEVSQWLH